GRYLSPVSPPDPPPRCVRVCETFAAHRKPVFQPMNEPNTPAPRVRAQDLVRGPRSSLICALGQNRFAVAVVKSRSDHLPAGNCYPIVIIGKAAVEDQLPRIAAVLRFPNLTEFRSRVTDRRAFE